MQVLIGDEAWQFNALFVDGACHLIQQCSKGLHDTHAIAVFLMGIGQLGPVEGQFISDSAAWKTGYFAVLEGIHRQQPGPYHNCMANLASFRPLEDADVEFLRDRFMDVDPKLSDAGRDMQVLVPTNKLAKEYNGLRFKDLPGRIYSSKAADTTSGSGVKVNALTTSPLLRTLEAKVGMESIVNMNQVSTVASVLLSLSLHG